MDYNNIKNFVKELVSIVVVAFILSLIIRFVAFEVRLIPSGSMYPTIKEQDRVMVNKFIYHFKEPVRGDIVVFDPPAVLEKDELYIKRVIGLPGETVEMKDGKVFINGESLDEPYLKEAVSYHYGPVIVPQDSLLVLGDNRNNSFDSHLWNAWLTRDRIKGKALLVYWPYNHFQLLQRGVSFS